ncbi:MAG: hypothetical protein M5U35_06625 [Roseovarius sp.]|nr:hypothetical protein [Roseovarius sp.]
MIRFTFIVPEALLPKANEILKRDCVKADVTFPPARWADSGGTHFSVASGMFEKGLRDRLDTLAASLKPPTVLRVHDQPAAANPEEILVLCGQKPLPALREAGLEMLEMPSPDPDEIR